MPKLILDQFSRLPITPDVRHRLRKMANGLCRDCGQPATLGSHYCLEHLKLNRERIRLRLHAKTRYPRAKSYWLESQAFVRQILAEPGTGNDSGIIAQEHRDADILTEKT